jgi:hypothetical protein
MRKLLLVLALFLSIFSQAQRKTVWGYLRDSATREPIALASITNLNTGKTVMTSQAGRFMVEIAENHVLSFSAVGYHLDTIHFTNVHLLEDTLSLILSPLTHNLGNVTVRSSGLSRYQLDSVERRQDFLQDVGTNKIPTVAQANSGAGIALNLDRFSKREKAKRTAWRFFDDNEKEAYINYRFTPDLVRKYTGLKDERLQQFMQLYRPSWDWLRRNTDEEDIKYYNNEKLKVYFKK